MTWPWVCWQVPVPPMVCGAVKFRKLLALISSVPAMLVAVVLMVWVTASVPPKSSTAPLSMASAPS